MLNFLFFSEREYRSADVIGLIPCTTEATDTTELFIHLASNTLSQIIIVSVVTDNLIAK